MLNTILSTLLALSNLFAKYVWFNIWHFFDSHLLFSFKYCIFRKNFEKPCAFHEFYMQVGWFLSWTHCCGLFHLVWCKFCLQYLWYLDTYLWDFCNLFDISWNVDIKYIQLNEVFPIFHSEQHCCKYCKNKNYNLHFVSKLQLGRHCRCVVSYSGTPGTKTKSLKIIQKV